MGFLRGLRPHLRPLLLPAGTRHALLTRRRNPLRPFDRLAAAAPPLGSGLQLALEQLKTMGKNKCAAFLQNKTNTSCYVQVRCLRPVHTPAAGACAVLHIAPPQWRGIERLAWVRPTSQPVRAGPAEPPATKRALPLAPECM